MYITRIPIIALSTTGADANAHVHIMQGIITLSVYLFKYCSVLCCAGLRRVLLTVGGMEIVLWMFMKEGNL